MDSLVPELVSLAFGDSLYCADAEFLCYTFNLFPFVAKLTRIFPESRPDGDVLKFLLLAVVRCSINGKLKDGG